MQGVRDSRCLCGMGSPTPDGARAEWRVEATRDMSPIGKADVIPTRHACEGIKRVDVQGTGARFVLARVEYRAAYRNVNHRGLEPVVERPKTTIGQGSD